MENNKGELRVWWFTNIPSTAKHYPVKDVEEAKKIIKELTEKEVNDKSVESNAGGLELYVGTDVDWETNDGWEEYHNDEGQDIMEIMEFEEESD